MPAYFAMALVSGLCAPELGTFDETITNAALLIPVGWQFRFCIFFPRANKPAVLIVEGEDGVRSVLRKFLQGGGYNVLEAHQGELALGLARPYPGAMVLVVSDVILPRLSGPTVMAQSSSVHPEIKMFYIAGYADTAGIQSLLREGVPRLQKPLSPSEFLSTADNLIHGGTRATAASTQAAHRQVGGLDGGTMC